jgi:hypothetical protein
MEENLTPTPKTESKPMTMDFPDAIRKIMEGKRVARISWGNKDYCLLKDGWLSVFTKGNLHTWTINDGDLEGQDWIVVTELN